MPVCRRYTTAGTCQLKVTATDIAGRSATKAQSVTVTADPARPAARLNLTPGAYSGTFVQLWLVDSWSDATLAADLANAKAAGLRTVVWQWTADGKNTVYPTTPPGYTKSTNTDVVGRLITAAYAAGLNVWIGLPDDLTT